MPPLSILISFRMKRYTRGAFKRTHARLNVSGCFFAKRLFIVLIADSKFMALIVAQRRDEQKGKWTRIVKNLAKVYNENWAEHKGHSKRYGGR
jgi:hypothetical protein